MLSIEIMVSLVVFPSGSIAFCFLFCLPMQSNKNLKSNAEANFFFFLCRAVNENGVDIRSQRIVFVMNLSLSCGEDGGRGGGGGIDSQCIVLKTAEGGLQGKGWKRISPGRSRGGGWNRFPMHRSKVGRGRSAGQRMERDRPGAFAITTPSGGHFFEIAFEFEF